MTEINIDFLHLFAFCRPCLFLFCFSVHTGAIAADFVDSASFSISKGIQLVMECIEMSVLKIKPQDFLDELFSRPARLFKCCFMQLFLLLQMLVYSLIVLK